MVFLNGKIYFDKNYPQRGVILEELGYNDLE